ncbi:hypothetical protein AB0F44_01110 [Nocardioides sp. NPDC023903]|uniref:hypothetical protein n=1 Tax=Nocardioides sp. NPDC023903 TaxID=3157195 RepID=UPI0033F42B00
MTPADLILNALADHGGRVVRGRADCPLRHHKSRLSVSVRPGVTDDGRARAIVKCHAGCSTPDILAAVGLSTRDLFDGARRAGYRPPTIPASPNPATWDRMMQTLYGEADWRRYPTWAHVVDRWGYDLAQRESAVGEMCLSHPAQPAIHCACPSGRALSPRELALNEVTAP